MTLQSHWARYVFCNDKPYGNLDYDFTIHPTDECFVATQPYKDYASSPYKNTIWIGMFGQHLAELLEDAGLLRQISQSEWSTVTSADGTRVASYSSIDRGFLKFHQVRSGDADKTTETSNGTYVREWHQSGMFCDLLAELNVGGRSNWVSTNNTQGQFPFTAEGITHDEELWLSSSAMYKVSSGNWEYSHLRWTGSNWLVTSAEHDEYESFINCQSD
ncbi:hypothetical protein JCM19236_5862 [Vibrio sp. JCM 19236]|nr:hypothetical protein JCM19236_5862 [Vibrio sp. JCM 19236]